MKQNKEVTAVALQEIVDKVVARELSKTSIFNPEDIYGSIKVLNRIDLVLTSLELAKATQFPLSFCTEMVKVIQDVLKPDKAK